MPAGILNMLATLHGLGPDNIIGQPYGGNMPSGEQPGGGINNLGSLPTAAAPDNGAVANVMQALNPPLASDPVSAAPAPAASPMASSAQPRARHSLLDVLGGLADAVATAGGAHPGYQPALDAATARDNAAQDRATAAGDHARQVNLDDMKLALTKNQLAMAQQTAGDTAKGKAIQAVQAIMDAHKDDADGGSAAVAKAWPILAAQANLNADDTAHIGGIIASDPAAMLDALDRNYNGGEEYSTAPIQAFNPKTGEYEIVQVGKHGGKNITKLEDGFTIPSASAIQVDAGGVKKVIDPRTGRVLSTTNVTASPDTVANNASRERTTAMQDASRADVERMRAEAAAQKGKANAPSTAEQYNAYSGARQGIVQMRNDILELAKNKNLSSATGFINGAVDTPARRDIEAKIAAIEGQATGVSVGILRAAGAKNPGQKEVLANAKGLISDLHLLRQSTGSFQQNAAAAVARLNQRIAMIDANARRSGIVHDDQPALPPARRPVLPAPAGARAPRAPSISNW